MEDKIIKSFVKFRIIGNGLPLEEITQKLGIVPKYSYRKGEAFPPSKVAQRTGAYEEDGWIFGIESDENETPEDCVIRLLEKLLPYAEYLKRLSELYTSTVWVSLYPEEEQTNLHISRKCMEQILKIGAELDVSTAFLKEFYEA